MSQFDKFVEAILDGSESLAKELFDSLEENAKEDANAFLEKSKRDLQRWTKQLANNEISKEDFTDFVQAKKDLAEMHAITQAGKTFSEIQRFRNKLIDLVIDTAFVVFL